MLYYPGQALQWQDRTVQVVDAGVAYTQCQREDGVVESINTQLLMDENPVVTFAMQSGELYYRVPPVTLVSTRSRLKLIQPEGTAA